MELNLDTERAPDAGNADIEWTTRGFYFRVLQEGEVGAGDVIEKIGEAKQRMTVADINALLYSSNHPRDQLERALQIEALSPGWPSGVAAEPNDRHKEWNAGLAPAAAAHSRWRQDFGRSG